MARYPGATWRPIAENETAPAIKPTQVILHSAVGSGSLYDLFEYNSNLESHFWVGFNAVEQYLDTLRQADANLDANVRAISIESADNGDPDHYPWTPYQVEHLVRLLVWANQTHGIPLRRCPAWDQTGIGYHTMWGSPSHWTPVRKTCPGAARIDQFDSILRAATARAAGLPSLAITEVTEVKLARASDGRVFVLGGGVKLLVPTPDMRDDLLAALGLATTDIPLMRGDTLSLFRTIVPTDDPLTTADIPAVTLAARDRVMTALTASLPLAATLADLPSVSAAIAEAVVTELVKVIGAGGSGVTLDQIRSLLESMQLRAPTP